VNDSQEILKVQSLDLTFLAIGVSILV
ncbi:MAG: hypothetical protein RLY14_2485, partial [Planctomycetota bacterium]|jgi:hypothetical protein